MATHGAPLPLVEPREGVEGAAELEGAHALQVLALEEHPRSELRVGRPRGEDRSAVRVALEASGGGDHVVVGGEGRGAHEPKDSAPPQARTS
jgi:hypothetical protein